MPGGSKSANKDLAAAKLAAGGTVAEAATAAGVHARTVFAWKQRDEQFRARIAEMRSQMVTTALGKLSDGMSAAADALVALVDNTDPDVRHRAAVQVITLALRVREQADIEERLQAVEELLKGRTDAPLQGADRDNREADACDSASGEG
jgi:hypothetical protein